MPTITTAQRDETARHSSRHAQAWHHDHTKLNHVSRSGMMRVIDLYVIEDNELRRITWLACKATATTYNEKHGACAWTGAAWIFGFAAVYHPGRTLWPDGTGTPARATVSPTGMVDMRSNTGGSPLRPDDPRWPFLTLALFAPEPPKSVSADRASAVSKTAAHQSKTTTCPPLYATQRRKNNDSPARSMLAKHCGMAA